MADQTPTTNAEPAAVATVNRDTAQQSYANQLTQEIRFAVVMFGGVSLAIYMNGIAQELLNAVRATAPPDASGKSPELKSTGTVYRKIGQMLYHGRTPKSEPDYSRTPIRTRFVIDILSGTSAGGINAVFLAKALANEQDLEQIHQIWLNEGDIDTLLNDENSQPSTYPAVTPKTSLLNSQRMYGKLLEAYEGMDADTPRPDQFASRLVEEMDLFVTATDLNGLSLPIQLANTVIEERMHKAHFHFLYRQNPVVTTSYDRKLQRRFAAQKEQIPAALQNRKSVTLQNDFSKAYNPMLAFASRCTSSFPAAFEPMKFQDVDWVLPGLPALLENQPNHIFRRFFDCFAGFDAPQALRPLGETQLPFTRRPLADGGYLNNKPFSFAIDTIRSRHSYLPVRRKLLYLDPFPELRAALEEQKRDFNFLQNSLLAASTLPRYQTIREDIERLNAYNRKIRSAQMLLDEVNEDLPDLLNKCLQRRKKQGERKFEETPLGVLTGPDQYGEGYVTYHRRCVSTTTDDLALLFTRLFGFNDESDAVYAIRMLIHAWRADKYSAQGGGGKLTETKFISDFDVSYRLRRLEYLRDEIDQLTTAAVKTNEEVQSLQKRLSAADPNIQLNTPDMQKFKDDLRDFRYAAQQASRELSQRHEQLWSAAAQAADPEARELRKKLLDALKPAGLEYADLQWILSPVTDAEGQERARKLYSSGLRDDDKQEPRPVKKAFEDAAQILAEALRKTLTAPSDIFLNAVNPAGNPAKRDAQGKLDKAAAEAQLNGPAATEIAARYLWVRYKYFECHDVIVYPLLPEQLTGEGCWTEVYRISPADTFGVFPAGDERSDDKLTGTALAAFGAFLDKEGRKNDILWGRLDGAERIIVSLLPDEEDRPLRDPLIKEAVEIILDEEFSPHHCGDMLKPLIAYLSSQLEKKGKNKDQTFTADEFLKFSEQAMNKDCPELVRAVVAAIQDNPDRLKVFQQFYARPSDPPVEVTLRRVRRASRIFGDMLNGLDGGQGLPTKIGSWLAQAGVLGTRFVEFSMPGTIPNVLMRHWLQLLYCAEALIIIIGGLTGLPQAEQTGWIALVITALLNVAGWVAGRIIGSRSWKSRLVLGLLIVVVFAGSAALISHAYRIPLLDWKTPVHTIIKLITKSR